MIKTGVELSSQAASFAVLAVEGVVLVTDSETGSSVVFPTVFCCFCNDSRFLTLTDEKKIIF